MPVAMMLDNPEGSQELYEELRARLQLDAPAGAPSMSLGPAQGAGGVSSRCSIRSRQPAGS